MPGIGLGLIASWAGSRALQSQLFGITAADLPAYAISGGLLLVAALLLACALPARRAANVNPIEALRTE